ncbi:MAG: phosphatidylinositol kinase [Acidobacteria bacterium]|nr:phosphatidylinositol kinase [Acidobacteriota bacterium]MBS1866588.1 phosphatidylinositol kinase [Acidobacteriota bacterium]
MAMLRALGHIRRMRGGAQSHLMRCSDGHYYVVKFQNNPQHPRILVNELLGTFLAKHLGLPVTPVAVIEVSPELIRLTPELCVELPRARVPCSPGLQFGSRYPGDPHRVTMLDFLPDELLMQVSNLHEFAGMLVFDKWTCNTNGRQTLFFPRELGDREQAERVYETVMIDQGFCFNAGEWTFPDAPLRGLYARNKVYSGIIGRESFDPWLERLEKNVSERLLHKLIGEIPPAWYADDLDSVNRLGEQLLRRRGRVPELILSARNTTRRPFPNWV